MAGKNIRGITVEIGGDTTKLGKAIQDSEKKSRSLQVELKEITKLLKFDPTNTELLTQKQAALGDIIEETSKKLEILKDAEKQVVEQFERGEIGEDQLRAFQREIIQTEKDLDSMKSELNDTRDALKKVADGTDTAEKHTDEYKESVEKAKEELSDFKEKAEGAFDTLKTGAAVLGGAIVATGGYALKLSTDFDKAFNTLVTKTGASAEEMDALNEAMENVYANNFGESIEDVANSMATVRTNTKLSGKELETATERALLLRDTFEFEVNESTRAAKMLMDQYGLSADEAYNLIAQGAQSGLDKNGDLLDTINEYAVHFKQLGIDAPTMFNMLVSGAESGTFSVDKLGDAIKEFGIRAKDGSDSSREAFEYLGYDADKVFQTFSEGGQKAADMTQILIDELTDMPDGIEKTTAGVALFGTMWEDLGAEGIRALSQLDGGISTTSDALDKINEQKYDDIGSALQGLGRTLETDVVKPLGEELKPVVEEAIEYVKANGPEIKEVLSQVVEKIGDFVGFIVDNSGAILSTIGGIAAGLVAWNVVSVITGVVNAIKAFKLANEGATVAQWLLNTAMSANPIALIVAAIAGLVTAFVLLWNNCEGFRQFWIDLWEGIKNVFSIVVDWIKENWQTMLLFLVNPLAGIFKYCYEHFEGFRNFVDNIVQNVKKFFSDLWSDIKTGCKKLVDSVVSFFASAWSGIKSAWASVKDWFSNLWSGIKNIYSSVSSWFGNIFRSAYNGIQSAWANTKTFFSGIWSGVKNTFSNVGSWFRNTFTNAWSAVKNAFSNWGSFFGGLWTTIKNKFSAIGTSIANAISGSVKSGINGVISRIESVINRGIGMINGAISLINKIPGVSIGKFATVSFPRLAKGGVVENPTLAEVGEDGAEAIIPLERNTGYLRTLAKELNNYLTPGDAGNAALLDKLDRIYDKLNRLKVVLDSGELVGGIIDSVDEALGDKSGKLERGW